MWGHFLISLSLSRLGFHTLALLAAFPEVNDNSVVLCLVGDPIICFQIICKKPLAWICINTWHICFRMSVHLTVSLRTPPEVAFKIVNGLSHGAVLCAICQTRGACWCLAGVCLTWGEVLLLLVHLIPTISIIRGFIIIAFCRIMSNIASFKWRRIFRLATFIFTCQLMRFIFVFIAIKTLPIPNPL